MTLTINWAQHCRSKGMKKSVAPLQQQIKEKEESEYAGSFMKFAKQGPGKKLQETEGKVKGTGASCSAKADGAHSSPKDVNGRTFVLADKMKKLELMMDSGDVEHALDVEEALHFYSLLKSPVYLDIVHKFLSEICSEFPMLHALTSAGMKDSCKER